jgi:F-type H+-transporting ATPase subunit b
MMEILSHNTIAWVAISFVIFVAMAVKFAGKKITSALDAKIAQIKADIETAERLKKEAQDLFADFEKKQRDAEVIAAKIIEDAKASARLVQEQAEQDLTQSMQRREEQLVQRLKQIEERAIADIQNHAADLAIAATREIVAKTLDEKTSKNLVDQAIQSVSKYLN